MSRRWITVWLMLGTILQMVLKPWGMFSGLELPILTGLVVFIALHTDLKRMLYAAILAGLLHDCFCPAPLGLSIPFFVMLAVGVNWIRHDVFGDSTVTYLLLGLVATMLETVYYAGVFSLSGLRPVWMGPLGLRLLGGLLASAVVFPMIAVVLLHWRSKTQTRWRRLV